MKKEKHVNFQKISKLFFKSVRKSKGTYLSLFPLLIILALIFSLPGCKASSNINNSSSQTLSTTQSTPAPISSNSSSNQDGIILSDGSTYEGQLDTNHKLTGYGKLLFTNGDTYCGDFQNGVRAGQGTYIWASSAKYVGTWENDQMNDYGTYTFSNSDQYIGNWKNNCMEGTGTYKFNDGTVMSGEWKTNKFQGAKNGN